MAALILGAHSLIACGSDDDDTHEHVRPVTGGSGGMTAGSGGTGAGGTGTTGSGGMGGSVSGGSGGMGGAGGGEEATLSNIPEAPITVSATGDAAGLKLVSSHFTQEDLGGDTYTELLAEVKNTGTKTLCHVRLTLRWLGTGGTELHKFFAFADAAPYATDGDSTLTVPCIAPGAVGAVWSNDFSSDAPRAADVKSMTAEFLTAVYPGAAPHPSAPVLHDGKILAGTFGGSSWRVTGSYAASATVYNLAFAAYVRDADGFMVGRLSDVKLDTLYAGDSWEVETTAYDGERPVSFLGTLNFIEGSQSAASGSDLAAIEGAASEIDSAEAQQERERRAVNAAREERARLAHAVH